MTLRGTCRLRSARPGGGFHEDRPDEKNEGEGEQRGTHGVPGLPARPHGCPVGRWLGRDGRSDDLVDRRDESEPAATLPDVDPLGSWQATPSQQATLKYFWIVAALLLVQMLLGVVTAHYGVEGDAFYGFPLSQWLPYSVTRTWHVQMGLFWIATAWLAAGLFIGPLVSGKEPPGQRLGVNVLFVALLVVVVGSLAGQWLSVHNKMSDTVSFLH